MFESQLTKFYFLYKNNATNMKSSLTYAYIDPSYLPISLDILTGSVVIFFSTII